MDASSLPKGKAMERNGDGRPINLPGVYIHKESGAKYTTADGDEGVIQADQLMSPVWAGSWKRVGDVPTRQELLIMRRAQELNDKRAEAKEKAAEEAELAAALK